MPRIAGIIIPGHSPMLHAVESGLFPLWSEIKITSVICRSWPSHVQNEVPFNHEAFISAHKERLNLDFQP